MSRIGIDARKLKRSNGGIGRYTRELLDHLLPLMTQHEVVVFLTEGDAAEWSCDLPHVRLHVCQATQYSFAEQWGFPRDLNRENLDLVHFLNFNHPLLYRGNFVVTLHDLTLLLFPGRGSKTSALKFALFKRVFLDAMHRSRHIIAISNYSRDDAARRLGISKGKMTVVYEGGPQPSPNAPSRELVTQAIGTPEDYFLFVSNWRPHKGLATLIEAYERFRAEGGTQKLVLVGNPDGADPKVLEAWETSQFRDDMIRPGFVSDEVLEALYRHSSAYVLPSEYEGFGLMVLEAFAFGAPVICAHNSSLPEVTGRGGLMFETNNADDLKAKLFELVKNPQLRAELLDEGRNHLAAFSWQKCAEETLAVYERVLRETQSQKSF